MAPRPSRSRPGRPKKDDVRETRAAWKFELKLQRDEELIAATHRRRSCFVLVTDWHAEDWDDVRVLAEYRHQHLVEGHTGFRWLKGPAAVAPVFLTPERIRAMGLVLVLALMVRNYIQTTLRSELKARGETLAHPFTKKKETMLDWAVAKYGHPTGFTTNSTWTSIWAELDAGRPVILSGYFTSDGHVVVLIGRTCSNDLIIHDPWGDWNTRYTAHDGAHRVYTFDKANAVLKANTRSKWTHMLQKR